MEREQCPALLVLRGSMGRTSVGRPVVPTHDFGDRERRNAGGCCVHCAARSTPMSYLDRQGELTMIHEEKIYVVACDVCGRDSEAVSQTSDPLAWLTPKEAREDWVRLDCGPEVAPNGTAVCWPCTARGEQA